MKRYFIDTEFLEQAHSNRVFPISIGVACDDGRTYYAVVADAPWVAIREDRWLRDNVLPHLPALVNSGYDLQPVGPEVKARWQIAQELTEFIDDVPEFWAWLGGYDYVVFSQLLGGMRDKPQHLPYFFNDIAQYATRLGIGPEQLPDTYWVDEHHALADALWTKQAWEFLRQREGVGHGG